MFSILVSVLLICVTVLGNAQEFDGFKSFIVGGLPSKIHLHPYQLSLRDFGFPICGATIISPNWALTAAHCIKKRQADNLSLNAGSTYVNRAGSIHEAKRVFVHPQYISIDYDFALIEVTVPFPIGQPNIASIELATVEPKPGDLAVITGWGVTKFKGSSPDELYVVKIPIISRDNCTKLYERYDYKITDRMICAAAKGGGKDACQGDSGGPLVVNGKLAGVVSDGIGCGCDGFPGIYANVANQLNWIKNITGL